MPGVTFLIEKIDGSYSEEATTDENGEIFIEHLEAGAYKVTEIRVPRQLHPERRPPDRNAGTQ